MNEMVDRVAQAIIGNPPRERVEFDDDGWKMSRDYERTARAAIEAIIPFVSGMPPARLIRISDTDPGRVWDIAAIAQHRAIVDYLQAALKEQA